MALLRGTSTIASAATTEVHWAYQPVRRVAPPAVRQEGWVRQPLDRWILARLEREGLGPSPMAAPDVLVRRLSYDLTGLPPTYEEAQAFVDDPSPAAYAALVEKWLASPRFGERWGRHWLDVARYSETKDLVLLFGKDRLRPFAYTYRDYVIRAMNEDLPLDQFITDQLAADRSAPTDQPWRLAAMGFLTLGRLFDNNPHDIYDDQIDVVTRGLLGLTVSCARCHDHKYDAITQSDYYALYGVFANSERPLDLPRIEDPAGVPGAEAFEASFAAKRQELANHIDAQYREITETARRRTADYLARVATESSGLGENAVFFLSLSPEDLRPGLLARWRRYLAERAMPDDPVFGPWHVLMALPADAWPGRAGALVAECKQRPAGTGRGQLNPVIREILTETAWQSREGLARAYGEAFVRVDQSATEGRHLEEAEAQLWDILTGPHGPLHFAKEQTYLHMSRVPRDKYGTLTKELDKLAAEAVPAPPARAMVLHDASDIRETRVFLRGNPNTPGPVVERRFLQVLGGSPEQAFREGSGRWELARAIVHPDNPLTKRVLVNRVWMHLMGEPLVSAPSDFGVRTPPPTHPELLDHLAWMLQEEGWSLKGLIRRMVTSSTYQQSSRDRAELRAVDPENRLWWRASRKRLDFEAMRDTLLLVAGRLDTTMGGPPVDVAGDPANPRRTVYGLVDRQDLPELFRAFDFASPDQSAARRTETIVPQQALFGLNSPFMRQQAKALAARLEGCSSDEDRVRSLYRWVLDRHPVAAEMERGLQFVEETRRAEGEGNDERLGPWAQYAQVLMMTNELLFLD